MHEKSYEAAAASDHVAYLEHVSMDAVIVDYFGRERAAVEEITVHCVCDDTGNFFKFELNKCIVLRFSGFLVSRNLPRD
jgi:hypothetical protein